ncbi:hypothetical protein [Liquorilactobacillus hordei]|uniref:hypothetical protein n=1 Tax=Liquorilactobacillus hordei TaxID=468911 RepID=UPI0039E9D1AF
MNIKDVPDNKFAVRNVAFDMQNGVRPTFNLEVAYLGDAYDALNALPKLVRGILKIKAEPIKQEISSELKADINKYAESLMESKFSQNKAQLDKLTETYMNTNFPRNDREFGLGLANREYVQREIKRGLKLSQEKNGTQSKSKHNAISKIRHHKRNSRPKKEETLIMNMMGDVVARVGD